MAVDPESRSPPLLFAVATAIFLFGVGLMLLDKGAAGAMFGVGAAAIAAFMAGVTHERRTKRH